MSTVLFAIPSDFNYVLSATGAAIAVFHLTGLLLSVSRASIFGNVDKDEAFLADIKKQGAQGEELPPIPKYGYPDDGSGRFAKALKYVDWVKFNKVVRGYLNYNEQIVCYVVSILLCGIYKPMWAFWAGLTVALGRLIYFIGYAYINFAVMAAGELPAHLAMLFNYGVFIYHLF